MFSELKGEFPSVLLRSVPFEAFSPNHPVLYQHLLRYVGRLVHEFSDLWRALDRKDGLVVLDEEAQGALL